MTPQAPPLAPGLYRAGDRTIKLLYAKGGLVHFWEITDPATADDPAGKVPASMALETFQADGFAKAGNDS